MWLAYLLASELLHKEGAWRSSNQYLRRAVALLEKAQMSGKISPKMPSPEQLTPQQYQSLLLNTRKTIGINAYHQKDYKTAISVFAEIAADEVLPRGTLLKMEDWKQRSHWAQLYRQNSISP